MKRSKENGITIVELLVVLGILALLLALIVPVFMTLKNNETLKGTSEYILSSIDQARSETLASVNTSSYCVHFQTNQIVVFKGTVYSSSDPNNEVIPVLSPAILSNLPSDFYFNRLTGEPNFSTPVTVTVSVSSSSKTITISPTGIASMN